MFFRLKDIGESAKGYKDTQSLFLSLSFSLFHCLFFISVPLTLCPISLSLISSNCLSIFTFGTTHLSVFLSVPLSWVYSVYRCLMFTKKIQTIYCTFRKSWLSKNFSTQFKVKKGINATSEKEGERN
jgi:hypothetical protein